MSRFTSPRWVVALGLLTALCAGAVLSAQRSSASMATAATKFLAGLSPEQRKTATLAFDGPERMRISFPPRRSLAMGWW
jgi:hypothetical protein